MTTTLRKRMLQDLQLTCLSERTQDAYLRAVRQLADHFHIRPDRLGEQQVRDYLLYLKNDRKLASTSLIVACCGIRFFYSHTAPRNWPPSGWSAYDGTNTPRRALRRRGATANHRFRSAEPSLPGVVAWPPDRI